MAGVHVIGIDTHLSLKNDLANNEPINHQGCN